MMHATQIQRLPPPQQLLQQLQLLRQQLRQQRRRRQLQLPLLRQAVQRIVIFKLVFVLMDAMVIKSVSKIVRMLTWYVYCVAMVFVKQPRLQLLQRLLPLPKKRAVPTNATLNSRNVSISAMGTRNVRLYAKMLIWHVLYVVTVFASPLQ